MKAYLFFNYPLGTVPESHQWDEYKNPDTTRLALFAAESWKRAGWEVERLSTHGVVGFSPFTGQLAESVKQYPMEFFNFWHVAETLAPAAFFTIDVFNYRFSPELAHSLATLAAFMRRGAVSLQADHWSCAAMLLTKDFCGKVIDLLPAYDRGAFPALKSLLVSDETVIREYLAKDYLIQNLASYALAAEGWEKAPLVHFPKSCIQHFTTKYLPV